MKWYSEGKICSWESNTNPSTSTTIRWNLAAGLLSINSTIHIELQNTPKRSLSDMHEKLFINQSTTNNITHTNRQHQMAIIDHRWIQLLRIVLHVARRVAISTRAINVRRLNIAMQPVKRNIVQSIREHAREELKNYMMKLFSKSIHLVKNVQFAFFPCHWMRTKLLSTLAVAKQFAVVVFMRWSKKNGGEEK